LELIVVDDCSTDATRDILSGLGIVSLTTGGNTGGPNRGRNIGLEMATGDYILIADHDDEWHQDRLITLLPHLQEARIVTSGYSIMKPNTPLPVSRQCREAKGVKQYQANETFLARLAREPSGQITYLGSIAYQAKLKHIRFEEVYGMVDFDWILRLFHHQASLEICRPLYTRWVEGDNLSMNEEYRKIDFSFALDYIRQFEREHPLEVQMSRKRIHGSMARYYYVSNKMELARRYFRKAGWNWKNVAYYLTTFGGSGWVRRRFDVFG